MQMTSEEKLSVGTYVPYVQCLIKSLIEICLSPADMYGVAFEDLTTHRKLSYLKHLEKYPFNRGRIISLLGELLESGKEAQDIFLQCGGLYVCKYIKEVKLPIIYCKKNKFYIDIYFKVISNINIYYK